MDCLLDADSYFTLFCIIHYVAGLFSSNSNGIIDVPSNDSYENRTLFFDVYVSKDTRSASVGVQVELTTGDPPRLVIQYVYQALLTISHIRAIYISHILSAIYSYLCSYRTALYNLRSE